MQEIDFEPFGRAIDRFRESLAERERQPRSDFVRDSVVLRFEFTYELAVVMLRRFLNTYGVCTEEAREATLPTLIRIGSEYGLLLHGWDRWYDYRKARNTTSHAYDEERAKEAVSIAPDFLVEAEFLSKRLKEKQP